MLLDNPYLNEFGNGKQGWSVGKDTRFELVKKYAWAVPTDDAVACIALYAKRVVEICAGTGYWAKMLSFMGVDMLCYDKEPYHNGHSDGEWFPVYKGTYHMAKLHSNRALMLCWPPYAEKIAYRCLSEYEGDTFIYIGEGNGGCTGDDDFHQLLEDEWEEIDQHDIPSWDGMRDMLTIYKRKQVQHR